MLNLARIQEKEHYWFVGKELLTVFEGDNLVGKGFDGVYTQPEGLAGSQISQELSQHHWCENKDQGALIVWSQKTCCRLWRPQSR